MLCVNTSHPGVELDIPKVFEQIGYLFYLVIPERNAFENPDEVPDYNLQVVPHLLFLLFLENLLLYYQRRRIVRVNDAIASMSHGIVQELSKTLGRGFQFLLYAYVYENCRLVNLPWQSPWTWFLAFIVMDFIYYWLHRACHEVNILWAAHQIHHSSEEFNLSTSLRQPFIQYFFSWVYYTPIAFFIPPGVFMVHVQLNLLYQFWIHTEVIKTLGPLEYILNTASHHRVHHGRNRYCIDKNYGGTLIIWDRMFGTFQPEKEEVVYGVTHPIKTFELFSLQLCHFRHIWRTFWKTEGVCNKMSVLFKGPGWAPGKPRTGCLEDIPDVKAPVEKYDPPLPLWCKLYAFLHFSLLVTIYMEIVEHKRVLPESLIWGSIAYEVFSLSTLGMILEARMYVPWIEVFRCSLYFVLDYYFLPYTRLTAFPPVFQLCYTYFLRSIYLSSILVWLQYCICIVVDKMQPNSTLTLCWTAVVLFYSSLFSKIISLFSQESNRNEDRKEDEKEVKENRKKY